MSAIEATGGATEGGIRPDWIPAEEYRDPNIPALERERLWVVESGRSSVLHLMRSRTPSTPNLMSLGSIAAQLLWRLGGDGVIRSASGQ